MTKHIVVIEDDGLLRETLEIILVDAGYKVTSMIAVNTVEELMSLNADCFIIDEQLPVITGHIICIILGNKPETKHIPVILTSASEELENFATLCEAHAFLQKPFQQADILALVQQMVSSIGQRVPRLGFPLNSFKD